MRALRALGYWVGVAVLYVVGIVVALLVCDLLFGPLTEAESARIGGTATGLALGWLIWGRT